MITKQDIIYYGFIIFLTLAFLTPRNIKYRHIHMTLCIGLSYLIIFSKKHPMFRQYLYRVRGILLIYFVVNFKVDPTISLLLVMLYLITVYQQKYETYEKFTSTYPDVLNTPVNTNMNQPQNALVDNNPINIKKLENEYKTDNDDIDIKNSLKMSDSKLKQISSNQISSNQIKNDGSPSDMLTFTDGYSAQGTSYNTTGYNYTSYSDLDTDKNIE